MRTKRKIRFEKTRIRSLKDLFYDELFLKKAERERGGGGDDLESGELHFDRRGRSFDVDADDQG